MRWGHANRRGVWRHGISLDHTRHARLGSEADGRKENENKDGEWRAKKRATIKVALLYRAEGERLLVATALL